MGHRNTRRNDDVNTEEEAAPYKRKRNALEEASPAFGLSSDSWILEQQEIHFYCLSQYKFVIAAQTLSHSVKNGKEKCIKKIEEALRCSGLSLWHCHTATA